MHKTLRRLASRCLWSLCRLLPVQKNKVVFCSAGGRGFGDNPKAIALELLKTPGLDLVWLCKDPSTPLPQGIRPCRFGSPQAVKELSTAKVWVNDSRGGAHYKKKGQKYLQTWHGFALKHIEASAKNLPEHYVSQCKKDSAMTDLMVSGSAFMSRVYREDFWYDGEIAPYGSPRNDVFFRDNTAVRETVCTFFGISPEKKILLYAPTFRDDGRMDCYGLDAQGVRKTLGEDWILLMRLHPNIAHLSGGLFPYDGKTVFDASSYGDMAELLLACDLLVTDYSSSMFDFALSGKPCVRFATDLRQYEKDRGFYFPLMDLPFPLAEDNGQLLHILGTELHRNGQEKWQKFSKENGFFEDGNASKRCAAWILRQIKGDETP